MKKFYGFLAVLIFLFLVCLKTEGEINAVNEPFAIIAEAGGEYAETDPPVITYTTIPSPSCTFTNMTINGVVITDATGIPLTGITTPRIYYRKNAGAWFSQPGTNTGGTATNSTWDFTIAETDMGGVAGGDIIYYYIIAQDLQPTPNTGSNPATGLVASGVNSVTTHPATPNTYTLKYNLNGTYTVGTGGNFATLTMAVNAYNNACALTGPVIFELINNNYSASETFPITINNHIDASPANTLTIRPSASATPVITGNVSSQTINLNGAKYIRFDGRQGGTGTTKSLTITSSATGITINFANDAQNDIIRYCVIKGQRPGANSGTIVFGLASGTGTGNDDNSIQDNDINEAGGYSNTGIFSSGTSGKENTGNAITNNNISNYFNAASNSYGIYLSQNSNTWAITGNHFFQTATRLYTATSIHFGIYINTGFGYTINNNVIGFANATGTGTTNMIGNSVALTGFPTSYTPSGTAVSIRYLGIGVSAFAGAASNIDGNTIGGIAMYTSSNVSINFGIFGGIYVESGTVNIGGNAGNIIGAATGNNSIYVATSGGGTLLAIRAAASGNIAIQNNIIGGIILSGNSASVTGNLTGISLSATASYTVSNNSIGNADADNIQLGYALSGGNLSNTGSLAAMNAGLTANFKGITVTSSGALSITNNTLRGWNMSCAATFNTGIESSGIIAGSSINVNNNFIGTASTNWLNSTVDNTGFFYTINVTSTFATTYNIKNNDIRGTFFGTKNGVGGSFLRLQGASSPNAIATISGNTFTGLGFRFSTATLYFIFTSYTLSSTGQLIIDNNKIMGNVTATGTGEYHMIHCAMSSSSGSQALITNNDFSNINAAAGFTSNFYGIYSSFSINPCTLAVTGNVLGNWTFGAGEMVGMEISGMTGTATCANNLLSNIASRGDVEGISLGPDGSSGVFDVRNNIISGIVSSGAGGYIYGISNYIPSVANTTQTTIRNNIVNGFSSTAGGIITGIFLDNGYSTATVSVTANKIYNLSGTAAGCHVYGIDNHTTLAGNIVYSNNYIGDLRAANANIALPGIAGIKLFMLGGQAKVYYNTVHLNASATATLFSTAAIYADAATAVTLRNNIFSNASAHGATGRTVAYWRGDTNLGTYDASSNNNVFYAGTPSTRNLIFYDATNSDQTTVAYKARVTPRDNLSYSVFPNFVSTTGADVTFLHLTATGNCGIASNGSNAGILLATDYDGDSRSALSPFLTDIGADEVTKVNVWTGDNSSDWNDAGNWSQAVIPNSSDLNVSISTPPAVQPVIAGTDIFQVGNLLLQPGASLTNKGNLKVAGALYGDPGSINNTQAGLIAGSIEMNRSCPIVQTLAGNIFVSNSVKNFRVSNDVAVSSVAGEHINISGELSFGAVTGKTFITGDNVSLLSRVNNTANVADITGNIITGKATVERYINTGLTADGRHLKSWQFLATPASGETIFQSWQENGTAPAGYGTWLTGTGIGFDATTATPSMKYYNNTTNTWNGITNTGNGISEKRGYLVFVRGDRTVNTLNGTPNPTILRIRGNLYQPTIPPPSTSVQAGRLESVGNPYASAISLVYMKNNGLFTNLDNDVTVWDPLLYGSYNLGGYQTLSAANNYEPTAGSTSTAYYQAGVSSPNIESGQAFFVRSSGTAGSVGFTEACKVGTNRLVNRTTDNSDREYFRATLFTSSNNIADGNAVVFGDNYDNLIDADDARKIENNGENFGILRNGETLSVEARRHVQVNDTVFYYFNNLRRQSYQLRFAPKNMEHVNLTAFLTDKFSGTETPLSLTDSNFVDINITADAASSAPDRFFVVFKRINVVPVTIASVSAIRNPDKTITVNWKVENEINIAKYNIENSADGRAFTAIASTSASANNGGAAVYNQIHTNPLTGNNFYRIKITDQDGSVKYSHVVKVDPLKENSVINIYPNPVENKIIRLHFLQQPAGVYRFQLINEQAQAVYKGNIVVSDSNSIQSVKLNSFVAAGSYSLHIYSPDGIKTILTVIIK